MTCERLRGSTSHTATNHQGSVLVKLDHIFRENVFCFSLCKASLNRRLHDRWWAWICCCWVVSNISWVIILYVLRRCTGLMFGCVSKVVNSLVVDQKAGLHILTEDQQVAPYNAKYKSLHNVTVNNSLASARAPIQILVSVIIPSRGTLSKCVFPWKQR